MSFAKLDKYKPAVKAVVRKPKDEPVEIVPDKIERKVGLRRDSALVDENPAQTTPQPASPDQQQQHQSQKEDIKFNEPDSEKNIIFMDQKELKSLQNELDPTAATANEIPQIKGATIYKLIERATTEKYADPNLLTDFLLTFRSFTNPRELLTLLVKRYHMPVPKDLSYGELQDWKQNTLRPIRLRVINLLKTWLEKYWKDFTEDTEMSAKLHEFLLEDVVSTGFQSSADHLTKAWDKKDRIFVFTETPPKPFLPKLNKSGGSSSTLALLDFNSEELARQLTLMEFNLYRNIKPWEFFNQAWTRKNKENTSPNVLKMIKRFNEVSTWVSTEVVKVEKLKDRIQVLGKFLEIADKCRTLNNFNAIMEILSGLQSSSVFRLKQTWAGLAGKQKELFEELKDLMSRAQNFQKLRKHIKACNPPLIPYLGLYLTDLTFIEDGNPDLIEGGLINWVKRRRLANVIKDIQHIQYCTADLLHRYQQKPYCLEDVPFIQDYLLNYQVLSEDEAYKLSLQRETRTPDKEPKDKKSLFGGSKKEEKAQKSSPQNTPKDAKSKTSSKPAEEEEPDEEDEFEIQYKAGYKFYDKDSEHNIIVEKDPKGEANDTIIAGTLPKLVERLTYEKYPDMNYMNSFVLTFRTFMSQMELLDLLHMRYHIPPPVNQQPDVLERFKQQKETPIQLRVLNVCKVWVDKYFEDFREDKSLLTKLLEFIDKSMMASPTMSRAGQNLKAQITTKLEAKEDKKSVHQFDTLPPEPILPTVDNPTLLDHHPEELARQMTLVEYDLFTSIKPLEYLYLNKPSSWLMNAEESLEEDPENLKSSPHVIRDWVATEIMKMDSKEARAKAIDHFIQIAQKCIALSNFHTVVSILSALNLEFILNLKSSWKLVPKNSFDAFMQLRELLSQKQNFKQIRERFGSINYPAIPYIGLYIQDLAGIKEQMPDTIEPGSFINFAKRQKMAILIQEIFHFQQTPYNLKVVQSIQDYLKQLDIYDMKEMKDLSVQYQEASGDKNITEDIFAKEKDPRSNSSSKLGTIGRSASNSPRSSSASLFPLDASGPSGSPRTSVSSGTGNANQSGSPRPSVNNGSVTLVSSQDTPSQEAPDKSPSVSGANNSAPPAEKPAEPTANVPPKSEPEPQQPQAQQPPPSQSSPPPQQTQQPPQQAPQVVVTPIATTPSEEPTSPPDKSVSPSATPTPIPASPSNAGPKLVRNDSAANINAQEAPVLDVVDTKLLKVFPNAKVSNWKAKDEQGVVYGWPGEDIVAKLITRNSDSYLVPLFSPNGNVKIDKAELSVCFRIGQFYEAQTKLKPTKVVAFAQQVTDTARPIASRVGMQVILSGP